MAQTTDTVPSPSHTTLSLKNPLGGEAVIAKQATQEKLEDISSQNIKNELPIRREALERQKLRSMIFNFLTRVDEAQGFGDDLKTSETPEFYFQRLLEEEAMMGTKQEKPEDISSQEIEIVKTTALDSKTDIPPQPNIEIHDKKFNEKQVNHLEFGLLSEFQTREYFIKSQKQEVEGQKEELKIEPKPQSSHEIAHSDSKVDHHEVELLNREENGSQKIPRTGHCLFLTRKAKEYSKNVFVNAPPIKKESYESLLRETGLYFKGVKRPKFATAVCEKPGLLSLSRIFQARLPRGEFSNVKYKKTAEKLTLLSREQKKYRFFKIFSMLADLNLFAI